MTVLNVYTFARLYAYLYGILKDRFNWHPRGLGFALRQVRKDRVIPLGSGVIFFDATISQSYARNIAGHWNEPETHKLFESLFLHLDITDFVDAGANVGEMLVDVGMRSRVKRLRAFEPISACQEVIRKTAELNGYSERLEIFPYAVSDTTGDIVSFRISDDISDSSLFVNNTSSREVTQVETIRLDDALGGCSSELLILLDIEGNELRAMQGGRSVIKRIHPVIIFEYNYVTRAHFTLDDVREELGTTYTLYRLRRDGRLDQNFEVTWNAVAIPRDREKVLRRQGLFC